ncbi:hypothetical protein [Rhizobium rhizosphaerae]|uniref:hypothetical protein n=1 Tax=Xaviernesmea rhizosphaerae TaxID=1672749 RepID=UPI000AB5F688|nr:hypothetical protein [Xaviernesmea rhizosphaerae]
MTQGLQKKFKTSPRRRELSANTRANRKAAGKPVQPNIVDEAISAAVQAASVRNVKATKSGNPTPPPILRVYDSLLDAAVEHLVTVRGLDRDQCKLALQSRLYKRRRYTDPDLKKR